MTPLDCGAEGLDCGDCWRGGGERGSSLLYMAQRHAFTMDDLWPMIMGPISALVLYTLWALIYLHLRRNTYTTRKKGERLMLMGLFWLFLYDCRLPFCQRADFAGGYRHYGAFDIGGFEFLWFCGLAGAAWMALPKVPLPTATGSARGVCQRRRRNECHASCGFARDPEGTAAKWIFVYASYWSA